MKPLSVDDDEETQVLKSNTKTEDEEVIATAEIVGEDDVDEVKKVAPKKEEAGNKPSWGKIGTGIAAYSFCSSSLLLLNKFAVASVPSTAFVLLCQFASSIIVVKLCGMFGLLEVDSLS